MPISDYSYNILTAESSFEGVSLILSFYISIVMNYFENSGEETKQDLLVAVHQAYCFLQ